ncbi:stage III sporulation protein AD [Aneurinibacillus thermoaerophilus]|uniref:Stage III sporulation protein AD n=1 Tax=Aneurinibacillus thermoaerophilus TaxID=143495 RepID=A0A1G8E845_ANETH|nr:stage III sporulation protein AD [Aneurinibacillus thermoaerophilus]MED0675604.1 stage III sporulation protein AD [Aneurinibacillus thermoaerophilus]MED0681285.1 stage III sporulation protein AD [Aneurinibacillus thermoaerophilus]MED0756611.1 stage III sporulation protein AD [Aneurinibacillus thermoaerophilus]MED0760661.1 stage III sporulation protein AD [Aneurinibacillus thermoaerophilus]MED0764306.1 stage III sporulation protein AD [Aneurinibacillus thermoaerophilus]
MDIIQIVGLGIVATILSLVVKEQKPMFSFILATFTGVVIFLFLIGKISDVIRVLEGIAMQAHVNIVYLDTILKIIGIAYIAEFGAQVTRDAGQGAIASKIELAGKILIMVLAIPILSVIVETIVQLLPS